MTTLLFISQIGSLLPLADTLRKKTFILSFIDFVTYILNKTKFDLFHRHWLNMIPNGLYITICFCLNVCFGSVEFYPNGPSHGDKYAPINDDGSSPEIPISTYFPFFDQQHEHLIVSILYGINSDSQ